MKLVALGHVTNDRLATGIVPGGSSLYAAFAAAELGAEARIETSAGPDWVGEELCRAAGISVGSRPAEVTTCFENTYGPHGRVQRVHGRAISLERPVASADVVFVCPVIGEIEDSALVAPKGAIVGAGLQGWLRALDADGVVHKQGYGDAARFDPCHVLFASEEDLGGGSATEDAVAELRRHAGLVVITDGARGSRLWQGDRVIHVPAYPTKEVDPTGAGDVFAVTVLLGLRAGETPAQAAIRGSCAASVVIEDVGPAALPRLGRELPARLARYAAQAGAPRESTA